ncbi:hypothetical protein ACFORO_12480 [Amycolatopsis halotolerans]|uniref:DUF222 domain-containing protein n=2 Tax=Amycolatopsis halotolerans TaxID=330083 RepID=A0ABV7QGI5_9PSEU
MCTGSVSLKGDDGQMLRDENGKVITRPCGKHAIDGATVCPSHGANAPQVKAKAAVRAEIQRMGLEDVNVDPGETLLMLIKQSKARVEMLAMELEDLIEQSGGLTKAMVGDTLVLDRDGNEVKVGEYTRGLYAEEARERDRCANYCVKGIAAGLAERQVRLAEKQGEQAALLLKAVFGDLDLNLTPEQRKAVPNVIRRHLSLVSGQG